MGNKLVSFLISKTKIRWSSGTQDDNENTSVALLLHILQRLITDRHRTPCFSSLFWPKIFRLSQIFKCLDHMHGIHVTILALYCAHFKDFATQKLLHVPPTKKGPAARMCPLGGQKWAVADSL